MSKKQKINEKKKLNKKYFWGEKWEKKERKKRRKKRPKMLGGEKIGQFLDERMQ